MIRASSLADGANLGNACAPIPRHPVGAEIFGSSQVIDGDVHAYRRCLTEPESVRPGWPTVGDAAGFIDPPTARASLRSCELLRRRCVGAKSRRQDVSDALTYYNEHPITYRLWFETLTRQILLHGRRGADGGGAACRHLFHRPRHSVYKNPEREFLHLPFEERDAVLGR
jgi:hypothetical protein